MVFFPQSSLDFTGRLVKEYGALCHFPGVSFLCSITGLVTRLDGVGRYPLSTHAQLIATHFLPR